MAKKTFSGASRALSKMNHRDLQRACVVRGMEFEEVVSRDVPGLASWFIEHNDRSQDHSLLNLFDQWKDEELRKRGYEKGDPVFHPSLRLGYIGEVDEKGNIVSTKKPRGLGLAKKKKKKRERDKATGLFTGTKKALTYECAKAGTDIGKTIEIVMDKFPEAQEKSIRIWYKRALKEAKTTKK